MLLLFKQSTKKDSNGNLGEYIPCGQPAKKR
jgi:hypothetical protein